MADAQKRKQAPGDNRDDKFGKKAKVCLFFLPAHVLHLDLILDSTAQFTQSLNYCFSVVQEVSHENVKRRIRSRAKAKNNNRAEQQANGKPPPKPKRPANPVAAAKSRPVIRAYGLPV